MGEAKRRQRAPRHTDFDRVMGDFRSIHANAVDHIGRSHSLRVEVLRKAAENKAILDGLIRRGDRFAIEAFVQGIFQNDVVVLVWEDADPRAPDMHVMIGKGSNDVLVAKVHRRQDPGFVALEMTDRRRAEIFAKLYGDWPSEGDDYMVRI